MTSIALPAITAFIVGVAEEALQWFLPARVRELKDVALNSVVIGCGLSAILALRRSPAASGGRRMPRGGRAGCPRSRS